MNAPTIDHIVSAAGAMRLVCAGADLSTVIRAERLQLRALDRDWADETLAALLRRLHEKSLARVNGCGSAGKCHARPSAKTPAVGERCIRLAAGVSEIPLGMSGFHTARANHGPAGASSEQSLRRARAGALQRGAP